MLKTLEEQKNFYRKHIKNCYSCQSCIINTFCQKHKYNNNLNMTCWVIFQEWIKENIKKGTKEK